MNHSIATADRNTHLKIVVVALVAAIAVVTVGIAAHVRTTGVELAGVMPLQQTMKVGVIKAGKPTTWTESGASAVR